MSVQPIVAAPERFPPLPEAGRAPRRRLPFSPWHLFLAPLAAIMLVPLVWMVVVSLETKQQATSFPPVLVPSSLQFSNYPAAWNAVPFAHFFVNSLLYSLATVAGNLLFCSLAAYAFARIRFFGRDVLFVVLLATLMVPFQVILIPTFLIVKQIGLVDSVGGLIMPNLCSAFGIFMLRQFFRTLPIELEEAARIDGTSRLGILFKIVLPLSLAGAGHAGDHPVHVVLERLPVAADHHRLPGPRPAPARALPAAGRTLHPMEPAHGRHGHEPDPHAAGVPVRPAVVHPLDRVHGDQMTTEGSACPA